MKYKITRQELLALNLKQSKNDYLRELAEKKFILDTPEDNFRLFKNDIIERGVTVEGIRQLGGDISSESSYETIRDKLANIVQDKEKAENIINSYSQIPSYFMYRILACVVAACPDQIDRQIFISNTSIVTSSNIYLNHDDDNEAYIQCEVQKFPLVDINQQTPICAIPGPVSVQFKLKKKTHDFNFELIPRVNEEAKEERSSIDKLSYEFVSIETDNINIIRMLKGKMFTLDHLIMQALTQTTLLADIPEKINSIFLKQEMRNEFNKKFIYFFIQESLLIFGWQQSLLLDHTSEKILHSSGKQEENTIDSIESKPISEKTPLDDITPQLVKEFILTIKKFIETYPWKISTFRNKGGVTIDDIESKLPTRVATIYTRCKAEITAIKPNWIACFNQITFTGKFASIDKPFNLFGINERLPGTQVFYDSFKEGYDEKEEIMTILKNNRVQH